MPLLEVENLHIHLGPTPAVHGVSFSLERGQTLCLVGESGCGKSITALSLARLIPSPPVSYPAGHIRLDGYEVLKLPDRDLRRLRGGVVSYVFQEPGACLNPVLRVGRQIQETLLAHRPEAATESEVVRWLQLVGIPAPELRARDYPHQLSGGMQQRVMIAMALASEPRLLVADEPTTALDVTIQAQILSLLRQLQRRFNMAILLITHNLGIVADIADHVAVMYAGELVETGPAAAVLSHPRHPYTRALIASVPEWGRRSARLQGIPGNVPVPGQAVAGCRFAPRCSLAQPACHTQHPEWTRVGADHHARCPVAT